MTKFKSRSSFKAKIGCFITAIVFIASIVAIFMFGDYVGGEVTRSLGWDVTSSVVNFIVGCLAIWLISTVVIVVLTIITMFCVGLYMIFFGG